MKYKQLDLFLDNPPPIILWENVPGVLNTKDNAFGCFLGGLGGLDVPISVQNGRWPSSGVVAGPQRKIAWRVLNAKHFGVPQQRKRVFVVATARTDCDPTKILFERSSLCGDSGESEETSEGFTAFAEGSFGTYRQSEQAATVRASGGYVGGGSETLILDFCHPCDVVRVSHGFVPTLTARMGTGGNNIPCLNENTRIRKLTPIECERLQGFPDNWTRINYRGKSQEDCPDAPRYKAIGNSWAVPVVRWIGERIKKEINKPLK